MNNNKLNRKGEVAIYSLVVNEKSFEEIRKENEETRKMLAEFNKGLHGDISNKYKPSLAEEMNLNVNKNKMLIGKGSIY